jgi:hypothetical protein
MIQFILNNKFKSFVLQLQLHMHVPKAHSYVIYMHSSYSNLYQVQYNVEGTIVLKTNIHVL